MTARWVPTTDLLQLRRLGKLLEELGEATAVAARCVIQGIDEVDPASGKTNRQRLQEELADVQAQLLCCADDLSLDTEFMDARSKQKLLRMAEWEAMFRDEGGAA